MRLTLFLAAPLAVLVAVAYGFAFDRLGHPLLVVPLLTGAAGWFLALLLRTPVGLVGMKVTGDADRTQTWVVASSGPLEEAVRLAVLLLVGRDLRTALWIGLGWASIEIVYSIASGFAMAALAERTDPDAERARAMLPPAAFGAAAPLWGVVERAWASAVHIGFTLILAAVPWLVLGTAPVHTLTNVGFLRLARQRGLFLTSLAGLVFGAVVLGTGWLLHL